MQEILDALAVVRDEKKTRGDAFRKAFLDTVRPLCVAYKCNIVDFKVDVLDIDVQVVDEQSAQVPATELLTSTSPVAL